MSNAIREKMSEHCRVIEAAMPQSDLLAQIADRVIECFNTGGRLYLLGNGGSAADAQHIAAELVGRFKKNRRALPAVALTTDSSILTAVSNDFGADDCFARQVEALATNSDIVWALSVSGTSPNVIRAMNRAKTIGATLIGFTGLLGGNLNELCDYCFQADHTDSDRVQETHQLAYHIICERIEETFLMSTL